MLVTIECKAVLQNKCLRLTIASAYIRLRFQSAVMDPEGNMETLLGLGSRVR